MPTGVYVRTAKIRRAISRAQKLVNLRPEVLRTKSLAHTGIQQSAATKRKKSIKSKLSWANPRVRCKRIKGMTGGKRSDETKNRMRLAQLGKKASVASKQRMSEAHKGRKHTAEARRKIGKAHKGNKHALGCVRTEAFKKNLSILNTGKKLSKEHIRKVREANIGRIHGPEFRRKKSLDMLQAYAEGRRVPPNSANLKMYKCGWIVTRKGGRFFYRSSWEELFAQLLDSSSLVKKFSYQPFKLPYELHKKPHTYFPDFLIELNDSRKFLVELKGGREVEEVVQAKKKAAVSFCRKNGLEFKLFRNKLSMISELTA